MESTVEKGIAAQIAGLYRFALLVSGDRDAARAEVSAVCAENAACADLRAAKCELAAALCRRLLESGETPPGDASPLAGLPLRARVLLALRFGAGLSGAEALAASGLDREEFFRCLSGYAAQWRQTPRSASGSI